eukprot:snap_masked-scaffold67_size430214-processed-gene-1.5 protein:Tk00770 transcript:snap_masked-scaffold67_size430214-processed-gene-1.5-mRNA-1 annotation:"threonine aspartase 1"
MARTEAGTVEMDAGIMDGQNLLFGAVGAMPEIKNPIVVAQLLIEEQRHGLLPLGRVPPGFMVGEGARDWAVRRGIAAVSQESLISEKSKKLYKHYMRKLNSYNAGQLAKRARRGAVEPVEVIEVEDDDPDDDKVTDTVGVVVLDRLGNIASTVSSGGIALKQPGRVGQASCFGCGCWAQNRMEPYGYAVGVSTTGCGEHLVRTLLARDCATEVARTPVPVLGLEQSMNNFVNSEFLESVPEKLGGAICLQYDPKNRRGEFMWTHTTASMGVAFQSTACKKAVTRMSRMPAMEKNSITIESIPFCTQGHDDTRMSIVKVEHGFRDSPNHKTVSSAVA